MVTCWKKIRVGSSEKYFILFFLLILNGVICKNVVLISHKVTRKVYISSIIHEILQIRLIRYNY